MARPALTIATDSSAAAVPLQPARAASPKSLSSSAATAPATTSVAVVFALCGLPAAIGVVASLCLEAMHVHSAWVTTAFVPLAVGACFGFAAAVALTHGVPGRLLHPGEWHFYQPMRGGWRFIVLQLLSWLSLTAVIAATGAVLCVYGADALERHGLWTFVAVAGVLAETFMVASVKSFDGAASPPSSPRRHHRSGHRHHQKAASTATTAAVDAVVPVAAAAAARPSAPWSSAATARRRRFRPFLHLLLAHDLPWLWSAARDAAGLVLHALAALRMLAVVAFLTNTQSVLVTVIVAPFVLLEWRTALAVFIVAWSIYGLTYRGRPEKTYVTAGRKRAGTGPQGRRGMKGRAARTKRRENY